MQFSLRALFVALTLAAVYCGVLFGLPTSIGNRFVSLFSIFLPAVIIGGVVYSRETWRAFWIGCAVGGVPLFLYASSGVISPTYAGREDPDRWYTYFFAIWHCVIVVNGLIVITMRWIYTRNRPPEGAIYSPPTEVPESDSSCSGVISK